jgi:hypothetical protein
MPICQMPFQMYVPLQAKSRYSPAATLVTSRIPTMILAQFAPFQSPSAAKR